MKNEKYHRIAIFRVIKTPKDEWTAKGNPIGDTIGLPYDEVIQGFSNAKQFTMQMGQGDGVLFYADELELIEIHHDKRWDAPPTIEELEEMLNAQGNIKKLRELKLKSINKK